LSSEHTTKESTDMDEATPETPPDRKPRERNRDFGTVAKLPSGKWRARYVDKAGNRHSKTFAGKTDARAFLARVQTDIERGDRTDPRRGRRTFEHYAQAWMDARAHKEPKTLEGDEAMLRLHVLPYFGRYAVADIEHDDVQAFVSAQIRSGVSAGTVRKRYRVVYGVLRQALRGKAVPINVAADIDLPSSRRRERPFLTPAEVEALADAATCPQRPAGAFHPEDGLRIRVAAYTGMRAAEIAGLRVRNVDLMRGVVHVRETTVVANRTVHEGRPTKTKQERTLVLPPFLVDMLRDHMAAIARQPNAFVFGTQRHNSWAKTPFRKAVAQAGLDPALTFHDLRHTCVAMLIDQGAQPKAIADHLGHATITTTMNQYGHLFRSTKDDLATRLNAARNAALATPIQAASVHQIDGFAAG
jgi:integrase